MILGKDEAVRFPTHVYPLLTPEDPQGMCDLAKYISKTYKKPAYLTEFGFCRKNEGSMNVEEAVDDEERIIYLREAMDGLRQATKEGADLRGLFVWSKPAAVISLIFKALTDNWEWSQGYQWRLSVIPRKFHTILMLNSGSAHLDVGRSVKLVKHSAYPIHRQAENLETNSETISQNDVRGEYALFILNRL